MPVAWARGIFQPRTTVQVKQMQAAALLEDANCFDYDSFFDDIQTQRQQEKVASYQKEKAGPRYLASMMAARDERQRMRDIIYEKKEAAAAKADAALFGEKEQFATSAYKKKLQEDKLFAEQMEARYAL
jgi:coiled-coil domain-containing protein 55